MAAREKLNENNFVNYFDHNPRKIEWNMTEEIELGVKFAETRLSDLTLQNEVKVLEFDKYGKHFITDMRMSPDAFVQVLECTNKSTVAYSFFFFLCRWLYKLLIMDSMANLNVLMNQP